MVGEIATPRDDVEALSCGEALIHLLEQYGVSTVFGIPGVHTLEAYRGLTHSSIRHVLCRHEQGAGFAADGWGRVSRAPGVCLVISGPGVTNVLTPVGQAYHDSKPLLVISGAVSAESHGRGPIHDLPDQRALTAELTAFSHRVEDPKELPEVLARAFEVFECGRPRPVHIAIPVDVFSQVTPRLWRIESDRKRPQANGAAVSESADLLAHARTPVILLGGGAVDAGPDALRVAERIGAAIGLTINGKGAIPSSHPLCLGAALSFRPVSDLIRSADVVVAVGTEFSELDWWGLDRPLDLQGRLIRIDIDAAQLDTPYPADVALHGDSAQVLAALAGRLADAGSGDSSAAEARVAEALDATQWPIDLTDHRPLLDVLEHALPADRIVTADSTQPAYAANHLLPIEHPRSWMMPVGYGTLGCALPMAIGAKLAAPDRPVACLVGDGGILFTLQELATARDLGLALPLIVWNNDGYGEISDSMLRDGIEPIGTDAGAHDLVAIARGFGCEAATTRSMDEASSLITIALGRDRPTVIEVRS